MTQPHLQRLAALQEFVHCTTRTLSEIDRLSTVITAPPDRAIFWEGTIGRQVCAVLEGSLVVTRDGVPLETLRRGDWFGALGVAHRRNITTSVRTLENCDLLVFSPREFASLRWRCPGLVTRIEAVNRVHDDQRAALSALSARAERAPSSGAGR